MKPFLILQLRPEAVVSDDEYAAILDKGGLTEDRAHRVRLDQDRLPEDLDLDQYAGVIVGGGPGCVSDAPETKSEMEARIETAVLGLMPEITGRDIPFLGCCYGIGILAHHLGAEVSKARYGEAVGTASCVVTREGKGDPIMIGLPDGFDAFVGHKEAVQELPEGCVHLLSSETCPFQMIRYGRNVYATQFHPEADADVFALRIEVYRDKGYFPPGDAARLIEACRAADAGMSARILRNFTERYG
ncbi:glutamine amidotransferase [Amaricoccus macauensis]|uniref:glutamine amidotransferase n=1 Tax=Amaricoccus macauensis TaxID=57001 RepID=UPI003C7E62CF